MDMDTDQTSHAAQNFTLRIWREELGNGQSERRGQIRQVGNGEVRYFRDWQTMVSCIEELLAESEGARKKELRGGD
jgi:hypothetical protein